ncbi:alpha-galactosidase [Sphingomonas sp.]|uniref:alpha-galactosidase n=1 Tax=Sphingomonas sp. TaxID=28214 RepID=UPI001DC1810C|nr:alpha-galactosidase [Sphingomonas sp.]MBX9795718.1 alpha-galactosidase [Sphingomonas sp.]
MDFYRIDGGALTLVFATDGGAPWPVHLGGRLPPDEDLTALSAASARPRHGSEPDISVSTTLSSSAGRGYLGPVAVALRRGGAAVTLGLNCRSVAAGDGRIAFTLADDAAGVSLQIDWAIGPGDMVSARSTLTNTGTTPLAIDWLASLALPLPGWADHVTRFHGRWAGEMQMETGPIPHGESGGAARGGRPDFGGANWLIAHEAAFGADHGRALSLHLAWSGGHQLVLARDADGAGVQLGGWLAPGEITLAPGAVFAAPEAMLAITAGGRNGVRRAFHAATRARLPGRAGWAPRRVHLNSWEACGFAMDADRLATLARHAAAIGAERFVVDDGWFAGRRDDRTSLGDWTVDAARFPHGLAPLIADVHALGMDFGLWVEPEMVSPDSDLYRAHPDWCVHLGDDRPTQRHQLVLNLTRLEVAEHLFTALDALLGAHPIAYLKWDHNRPLFPNPAGHAQALAHYALLDRLRAAHPHVEIESCASGGGRIDLGVLSRCHRVWPSDNNDAVERLRLMRAWSLFLPPEVLGNHVGPSPNPITGRALPMAFRARVALLGHMGVEADPAAMTADERDTLAQHIALYKEWRDVLHGGDWHELDAGPGLFGTLVTDGRRALALIARVDSAGDYNAPPIRLPALDPARLHAVSFPLSRRAPLTLSGRFLGETGLTLPLARPATARLIALEAL